MSEGVEADVLQGLCSVAQAGLDSSADHLSVLAKVGQDGIRVTGAVTLAREGRSQDEGRGEEEQECNEGLHFVDRALHPAQVSQRVCLRCSRAESTHLSQSMPVHECASRSISNLGGLSRRPQSNY